MGVFTQFGDRIRGYLRKDKESIALDLAKGMTASNPGLGSGIGFDMLQLYGPDIISQYLRIEQDLLTRYAEFENMNEYPELHVALNIFADDAAVPNMQKNRVIWVTAKDRTTEITLDDLLHRKLGMDDDMWSIARTLVMYGNAYNELLVTDRGVESYVQLAPHTMRRIEGPRGELFGFIQDFRGKVGYGIQDYMSMIAQRFASSVNPNTPSFTSYNNRCIPFEDWEISHFRLRSHNPRGIYGRSVMDGARWIYKRLNLLEDAALIYKLQRAPQRYAFYVDVGNNPPAEAMQLMNRVRQQYRKKQFINPSTNQIDLRFSAIAPIDDIFIPVREGAIGSKVEVLNSPQWNCLTGDTKIPLLDGTEISIKDMTDKGGKYWVYSCDEAGNIVPGKAHSPRITHENAEIYEVELDNGEVVSCTGNHPFMARDGSWILAENLTAGQSLMPLYRKSSQKANGDHLTGYELVYVPALKKQRCTHHVIFEATTGIACRDVWKSGSIIHHKDHRKRNNSPDNLAAMSRRDHELEHRGDASHLHTPEMYAHQRTMDKQRGESLRKTYAQNPAYRELQRKHLAKYRKDPGVIARRSAQITAWNKSQDHIDRVSGSNNSRWVEYSVEDLKEDIKRTGARTIRDLIDKHRVSQHKIEKALRTAGITWKVFAAENISGRKPWNPAGKRVPRYLEGDDYNRKKKENSDLPNNHQVVRVTKTNRTEVVYDITVDDYHNFAISQGVFVHNSTEDLGYFLNKMVAAIGVPRSYLNYDKGVGKNQACLTGDTQVPLLDGRIRTMKELAAEYGSEGVFYVYSCDVNGNITVGKAGGSGNGPRITRQNAEIWEVLLDDGTKIRATPDHRFLMRDGSYKELQQLGVDDSLMPLYTRYSDEKKKDRITGYEMVKHPSNGKWDYTHRFVSNTKWGGGWSKRNPEIKDHSVCHHADFNRLNNSPDNLEKMFSRDHIRYHQVFAEKTLQRPDVIEKRMAGVSKWANSDRCKDIARANARAAQANKDSNWWKWQQSAEHKEAKSEQLKAQLADPNGKTRVALASKDVRDRTTESYKKWRNIPENSQKWKGANNSCYRHDITLDTLRKAYSDPACKTRPDLNRMLGCSDRLINRVLSENNLTYSEFKVSCKGLPVYKTLPKYISKAARSQDNHKVVSVMQVGIEDVYDFGVETHHNFAIKCKEGGTFVHNSSADVRFGRTVLRIQQELRAGVGKICRVHLAAIDMDPNAADYDVKMEPPSAIFSLAQMEVQSARADLAGRMKEYVSHYWMLSEIFDMSDDDIKQIVMEQDSDRERDIEFQARTAEALGKVQTDSQMQIMDKQSAMQTQQVMASQQAAAAMQPAPKASSKPSSQTSSLFPTGGFKLNENELMKGNKEAEKRATAKMNQMLENDEALSERISEIKGLLKELSASAKSVKW